MAEVQTTCLQKIYLHKFHFVVLEVILIEN